MEKRYYIAYGSNLNIRQMRMRCPSARIIGTGAIPGYRLLFKGSQSGSYLTIEPKEGASVPVAAWEVTASDEQALDRYEGFPSFYYKKELSFWRVLAAHVVVAIICNVILNTWCLSILYGKAFSVLLPARLVKNAIMCPIDAFIFYNIAKVLDVTGIFKLVKEEKK